MSEGGEDLQARLAALCARFSRLALELDEAGHDLRDRATLPPESLLGDMNAALGDLEELRTRIAVIAGEADALAGLRDLEAAVQALVEKEEGRARQQAEQARQRAEEEARREAEAQARLQAEREARRQAEEEARRRDREEAQRQAQEEAQQRAQQEARQRAQEEARRQAYEEAQRQAQEEAQRQAQEEARRKAEEDARRKAIDETRGKVEATPHRGAGDRPRGTMTAAFEAHQKAAEAGAQWWFSAAAAWKEQRARGVAFADAVRQELGRFPYLFSVPIQESAQYGEGLLADAYAVVLHHVERRSPGFVDKVQERVGAGGALSTRLYQHLAREGRLIETYADLVREVMVAALPNPGVWIDAGISETEPATARFERSATKIGSSELRPHRVPDEQRFGEHRFTCTVAPFTARFVRVNASELREPRSVEVMLKAGEAASDHAWILTVGAGAAAGSQGPLLRHSRAGTPVSGLGREWSAVWIAVFNPSPDKTEAFELTVTLRRGPAPAKPSAFARAAPKGR